MLLPSRFGKSHNRSLSYYGSWIRLLTLLFTNITLFSTQNSLLITSCLKAVNLRNVLEKLRGGCYGAMHSSKKPKVECILYLSRDMMSKMWDEDRENIVECRYGQLSSTEKIIIIKKQNKPGAIQNKIICRANVAQLYTVNSIETSTISHLSSDFLLRLIYISITEVFL